MNINRTNKVNQKLEFMIHDSWYIKGTKFIAERATKEMKEN